MFASVKCKKCRGILLNNAECRSLLINAHSLSKLEATPACSKMTEEKLLFISEDCLPDWIKKTVEEDNWEKGKINCKFCGTKIGAFDYISGIQCNCKEIVMPAVHFIKSKIDPGIVVNI